MIRKTPISILIMNVAKIAIEFVPHKIVKMLGINIPIRIPIAILPFRFLPNSLL